MPEFREITSNANPFVERAYPSHEGEGLRPKSETSRASADKPLRRFIGFLGKVMHDGRRKIYTTPALDEGVEVPDAAIRILLESPPNQTDGLKRDVVWVAADADIIYFSRRSSQANDPSGGDGFPRGYPYS